MAAYDMDSVMKRGRGRPKKDVTRDIMVTMRFDGGEREMLESLVSERGESKSDIIRKALRGYYAYLKEVNK